MNGGNNILLGKIFMSWLKLVFKSDRVTKVVAESIPDVLQ